MIGSDIYEVRVRPGRISVFCQMSDESVNLGDWVILDIEDERECGQLIRGPFVEEDFECINQTHKVVRKATPEDLETLRKNRDVEVEAIRTCKDKIADLDLPMKLIAVDVLFDKAKIKFFFTAEGRVDFRELVRQLAQVYRTRIEMRQIGVRDGSKLIGGIGICGQTLCCCRWLRKFMPITIKMAKQQNLSLNPQKISGNCGRLLCCLSYEVDTYRDAKKNFPRLGTRMDTPAGSGPVKEINIIKNTVTVAVGDFMHEFTMEELRQFQQAADEQQVEEAVEEEISSEELEQLKDLED